MNKLVLIAFALALTGCGKNLHEYAKLAEEEIGIPVVVQTSDEDSCALEQFKAIYNDYDALTKTGKSLAKDKLREKFQTIVINPTKNVQQIQTEMNTLQLVDRFCNDGWNHYPDHHWRDGGYPYYRNCQAFVRESKILDRDSKVVGDAPKTIVEKSPSLTINTQSSTEMMTTREFWTPYFDVYFRTMSTKDASFDFYYYNGAIRGGWTTPNSYTDCGTLVSLDDLIQ